MRNRGSCLVLCAALLMSAGLTARADDSTKPATVAVFAFDRTVTEKPVSDDPLFGSVGSETLYSLIERLDEAAEDEEVKAVVLLAGSSTLPYAQAEEVRAAIDRIRESGKKVYAHADSLRTPQYALLCGASRLSVAPTGDVWVTGLYGEQLYVRGLLDLLGVKPDFLTCGEYKSAGEMFTRTGPSPESEEMYKWLYDGLFESVINLVATGRGVDAKQARKWIDQGLYSAESAREAGLIDAVEHRQAFSQAIQDDLGTEVEYDKSYGKKKGPSIDLNNPFAAFQLWAEILAGPQRRRSNKDAIAVVYVDGPIMPGKSQPSIFGTGEAAYSEPIRKALDKLIDDDKVKGVVLRVSSPGGSAVASEIILNATQRVAAKKPFVVSMGSVAGSGGYYVACAGQRIFADSATITGSIGVISGKLVTEGMWNRIGINFEANKRGEKAGMLAGSDLFTEEERDEMQAWMNEVYEVFKGHVVDNRGDKLAKPIEELAGGRVYTGQQALEYGLVDEIGGLNDAIAWVADKADVDDYDVRVVPRPTNFLEELLNELSGQQNKDNGDLQLAGPTGSGLVDAALPMLRQLDPRRLQLVLSALRQAELLKHERVMLTMPLIELSD
ncbi:Protease 4 [Maioricimonas rarisocia]|uniref:Protease 4 n=1 Tax=Maioricimonas rarisocia TaxID=2528026 RepID=A0A517Z6A5_9PLAN|nr:signal peptide peptidase SppA [Maioricimonas rarisocia]QDU37995.1 Protease 4 [Maioricimonas rarisocia]